MIFKSKKKYFVKISAIVILISGLFTTLSSQNIYSVLHHDRKADLRDSVLVLKITSDNIFYNKEGKEKKKEITLLNKNHHVLSQTRFDGDGKKTARLIFEFDSTGTISLRRKIERWQNYIGYSSEIAYYHYDSSLYLVKIVDKGANGIILGETILENNEQGHPQKLTLKVPNSKSIGFERANYNYIENQVISEVVDENGIVLSNRTAKLIFQLSIILVQFIMN